MAYPYTNGDGLAVIDPLLPDGAAEPVANLDDALRQVKAYLKDPTAGPEALINAVVAAANPPGSFKNFAMAGLPTGYLACDGSAVSRTTYAALFAAIGTVWGVGDGSTTFNVPNMCGRAMVGVGLGTAPNASSWALAQEKGDEVHLLIIAEIPAHTHTVGTAPNRSGTAGANPIWANDSSTNTGSVGGDTAHNNLQPSVGVTVAIKT